MLLKINKKNKEISLEQVCENVKTLEEYAEIVVDMEEIVTSIENPFRQLKKYGAFEQCKAVYNALKDNSYTVNDLYFATEFLMQVLNENIVNTVKEREILIKTTELLVDILSDILESKIEIGSSYLNTDVQVLAIELILKLNVKVIKSKLYYTQKEVEFLFTNHFLPSIVYEFRQFRGVEHKKVSSNWIGRKLGEIVDHNSEIITVSRKKYISINVIKELEKSIYRVSDSLETISEIEEEVIILESRIFRKEADLVQLSKTNNDWGDEVKKYFRGPIELLYQLIFIDYYLKFYIILQSSSLPLIVDEIIEQLEYQFQNKTGFKLYFETNDLFLHKMSTTIHEFVENISTKTVSGSVIEDFSAIKNLDGLRQSIAVLNSVHSGINLFETARKLFLEKDNEADKDFLKNTIYSCKKYFDRVACKHIDSIENNLLFLEQKSSQAERTYITLDKYSNKK